MLVASKDYYGRKAMNVYITEAGSVFGLGHIKRYEALCSIFPELNLQLILNQYSDVPFCGRRWSNNNISDMLEIIQMSDVIFFDSFIASEIIMKELESAKKLIVIDDYIRRNWKKGLIIDWTIDSEKWRSSVGDDHAFGLDYLATRSQFNDYKVLKKRFLNKDKSDWNILTIFGGSDLLNLTEKVRDSLSEYRNVKSIGTKFYPCYEKYKNNKKFYWDVEDSDYVKILSHADLVITAAGQTLYELACLGVPSLCISTNENQHEDFVGFSKNNLTIPIQVSELNTDDFIKKIDYNEIESMLNKFNEIDGRGEKIQRKVRDYLCT